MPTPNDPLAVMVEAAARAAAQQPASLEMIRREGFVFDGSGGRWEKLAFSLYSNLCEVESILRHAREHVDELEAENV